MEYQKIANLIDGASNRPYTMLIAKSKLKLQY